MRKTAWKTIVALLVLGISGFFGCGSSEAPPGEAPPSPAPEITGSTVRLAVFHPTAGTMKILEALRENGLLAVDDLLVIGVYHTKQTTNFETARTYVRDKGLGWISFRAVSGEIDPVSLFQKNGCTAEFEAIFRETDGVIFFGGDDIPPRVYGRKAGFLTGTRTPYRHYLEISMIFHLLGGYQDPGFIPFLASAPDYPLLGICLGGQSLNVGTGGTMIQDIPTEEYGMRYQEDILELSSENWHRNPYLRLFPENDLTGWSLHPIRLSEEAGLFREWGFSPESMPRVLSSHHQMMDGLGRGLRVIARSMDGRIVEAVDHEKYPHVLGIQFHPEMDFLWDGSEIFRFDPDDAEGVSFAALLAETPSSVEFHKKLWAWFSGKVRDYRAGRSN